ncbi:MAG: hypothetical protein EP298_01825 [Gammaproteobacteria bacterium]|nr:MAG: hypothetical protein EP298_01825 [Gammaproteobacteria bacterium]UTW41378.1 hypothetical protein KFE69_07595 [bacterium SCSIO 12844]
MLHSKGITMTEIELLDIFDDFFKKYSYLKSINQAETYQDYSECIESCFAPKKSEILLLSPRSIAQNIIYYQGGTCDEISVTLGEKMSESIIETDLFCQFELWKVITEIPGHAYNYLKIKLDDEIKYYRLDLWEDEVKEISSQQYDSCNDDRWGVSKKVYKWDQDTLANSQKEPTLLLPGPMVKNTTKKTSYPLYIYGNSKSSTNVVEQIEQLRKKTKSNTRKNYIRTNIDNRSAESCRYTPYLSTENITTLTDFNIENLEYPSETNSPPLYFLNSDDEWLFGDSFSFD